MLAGKSPEIPDPLQVAGQQNQLKLQQQALQTGQLQQVGLGQENQMRQIQMQRTQALNDAYTQAYHEALGDSSSQPASAQPTPATGAPTPGAAPNPGAAPTPAIVNASTGGGNPATSVTPAANENPAATGAPTGATRGSAPALDFSKISARLPQLLALGGVGSAIPEVMKGITDYQASITDLAKKRTELNTTQADAAGALGSTVAKAGYSPQLLLLLGLNALHAGAVDVNQVGPVLQQVQQALQQDPTGETAKNITKQFADTWANLSPTQQKLANEGLTAQGGADRGKAALTDAGIKQDAANMQNAISDLAARKPADSQGYQQFVDGLPHATAVRLLRIVPADQYDPKSSIADLQYAGMSPDQQRTTDLRAQEVAKQNSLPELANKAAQGDPVAKRALDLLKEQSIEERKASNPNVTVALTPAGQAVYDRALETTGQPIAIPRGPGGTQVVSSLNRIGANNPDFNAGATKATFAADKGSLTAMQKQRDAVGAFEQTAGKNLDLFVNAASKIPDSGVPWLNTPLRLLTDKLVGSENMAAVNAARQIATTEIAKVTSNPTLAGTLSDAARKEVQDYNPQNATFKQTLAVAKVLRQDMANRRTALDQGITEIQGRIANNGQAPKTPTKSLDEIFGGKK